jgi:UDP-N-acetyl-D-glucosamine/UDP-N-acetyl-D-galactosamine dehydrogenase
MCRGNVDEDNVNERIGVIGLGYVGLPVALAFAKHFPGTIGFDVNANRVEALRRGTDETREVHAQELQSSTLDVTTDPARLAECSFLVVAVPTPIDGAHAPDLRPVKSASETIGRHLRPGSVVVYESTVYPGVTEDVCGPLLEQVSGLRRGVDFTLGYSPERINPGDRLHRFEHITKVVSGEDAATLERVANAYGRVVEAGVHRAPSIRVAEAAKVIENVQRDLNVALMNELALICDRIGIRTHDVLAAAGTKWNFLKFEPGLVGGHCIGVDPYYLTTLAESVGYDPQVILAGRRINEGMGPFVAQRLVKLLANADVRIKSARVAILGLSFKQDVPDLRNTKVVDIVHELRHFGIDPMIVDPLVSAAEAHEEYGLRLTPWEELGSLDAMVLAVPHRELISQPTEQLVAPLKPNAVFMDLKSAIEPGKLRSDLTYWSL